MPRPSKPARLVKWRHTPYWYIRDVGTCVSTGKEDFEEAKAVLAEHEHIKKFGSAPSVIETDQALNETLRRLIRRASARSKRRGMEFGLTLDDLRTIFNSQHGKCALTGIEFYLSKSTSGRRMPYAPSLDRLDNSIGYTVANTRIVCTIANLARGDFSDEEFYAMCEGVSETKKLWISRVSVELNRNPNSQASEGGE